jgi:hypothetical protein
VRRRVAGREHFLSLDPRPLDAASAWMARERAENAIERTSWPGRGRGSS